MAEKPKPANQPQQQMFSNLLASKPKKERGGPMTVFLSTTLHIGLIGLAVYVTGRVKEVVENDDKLTPLIAIEDVEPEPPPPPPPPPDQPPPQQQAAEPVEVPKGFQTLAPPTIIPPDIPPPSSGPVIRESDFTGEGIKGGRSDGTVTKVTAENIEAAPVFTPYTVAPQLKNQAQVAAALQRLYPPLLRDSGIGGSVDIWFFIDETGTVRRTDIKKGSGHASLDEAALKVADLMQFTPALNRDQKVKVWVAMPIVFRSQ